MHGSGRRDEVDSNYDPARHSISYDHSDLIIVLGTLDEFCIRCADNIDDSWTYHTRDETCCCFPLLSDEVKSKRIMMQARPLGPTLGGHGTPVPSAMKVTGPSPSSGVLSAVFWVRLLNFGIFPILKLLHISQSI